VLKLLPAKVESLYAMNAQMFKWAFKTMDKQLKSFFFPPMTEEQIQMLRWLIKDEIEAAGIDGMEHGVWGWAEKQLDENWKKFQKTFEAQ